MSDLDEIELIAAFIENGSLPPDIPEDFRLSLIWKGILLSLRLNGSIKAVDLLRTIGSQLERLEYNHMAVRFLGEMAIETLPEASDSLFELANTFQNPNAIAFLKSHPEIRQDKRLEALFLYLNSETQEYQSFDPRQTILSEIFFTLPKNLQDRVTNLAPSKGLKNWAIVVKALQNHDFLPEFVVTFPQCQDFERDLFFQFVRSSENVSKAIQNAICQIFILYDYSPAKDLAIERSFGPDDPVQAALFYFLAEEWHLYEEIDFSHRLLNTAYELSAQPVRRKILALSRSAGQVEWMKNLTAGSQTRWLNELSDPEWEATFQTLLSAGRMDDLWLLAQSAPPLWSGRILLALEDAHWAPGKDEEKIGYVYLSELARTCRSNPFILLPQATWHSPAKEVSSMAMDRSGIELAAGNSQTAILRWRLDKIPVPENTIFSPTSGAYAMSFNSDGKYLAVSGGDHKTRIFDYSKGAIIKVIEGHNGLVRALAFPPDGRFLYTASFDGTIQAWRFPNGTRHNMIPVSRRELFGLAISPDGKILLCAGAERKIQVYSLPEGDLLRSLEGHQDTITLLAASETGTQAASFSRDLTLKFWNYTSGKEIGSGQLDEPLASLIFHPSGKYVFGGSLNGKIQIWSFPAGNLLHTMNCDPKALVGLAIDRTGQKMISANASGVICQWNLTVFNSMRTPVELLIINSSAASKTTSDDSVENGQAWITFIGELIKWRKRFDIEVGEIHPILHLDEYDIEL